MASGIIWTPEERTTQPRAGVRLAAAVADADLAYVSTMGRQAVVGGPLSLVSSAAPLYEVDQYGTFHWAPTSPTEGAGINASPRHATGTLTEATLIVFQRITDASALSGWHDFQSTAVNSHFPYSGVCYLSTFSTSRWLSGATLPSSVEKPHVVVVRANGTERKAWVNGALLGSGTADSTVQWSSFCIGTPNSGIRCYSQTYALLVLPRAVSDSFIAALQPEKFWQLFEADNDPVFYSLGGGGTVAGVGSSTGTGTATGVGASTSAQVGSSSGTCTATGVGASTANSVGSSSGTGAASGVGSSTGGSDGAGSSSGTGTATGIGASTAASVGSIGGVGTASGIGASTAASTGSANGTGTATGVGENGSVTVSGVGSASGTGTATGIAPSHGGGNGTGRNLSRKQKKKLKAVESQEWLKAEETARQLLNDRFTKQTPQEKAEALQTYVESLQPVIEALKALTTQVEEVAEVVEEIPVVELTPHQEILSRFDTLEKKLKSVEELVIILMADL